MKKTELLKVKNLVKHFDISGSLLDRIRFEKGRFVLNKTVVKAVNSVSLTIHEGEILSIVGESGCSKSTLAGTIMGLHTPESGEIYFQNQRIDGLSPHRMLPYRKKMQMIFQDPYASLNPRKTIRQALEEPVMFHNPGMGKSEVKDKVEEVMRLVGVDPFWVGRYPHEFSGGQRQRISIARALAVDPIFIAADEPVSALDVSIQAQILNLLMEALEKKGLTYMFISHDLSVVKHISNRVGVMYLGTICELSTTKNLFDSPRHPYTKALLSAIPVLGRKDKSHVKLKGEIPSPIHLPSGCVFHSRCVYMNERCTVEVPELKNLENGAQVACHGVSEGRI